MTLEELGRMLKDLEETRKLAEAELASAAARRDRMEGLERDRDDLLSYMSDAVPEGLEGLTGEERNKLYRMLRLEVTPSSEGYEVKGVFCTTSLPPSRIRKATTSISMSRPQAKNSYSERSWSFRPDRRAEGLTYNWLSVARTIY